jgi:hypothetical protein
MTTPNAQVQSAVSGAMAAVAQESDSVKQAIGSSAAAAAAAAAVPAPNERTTSILWIIFVSTLCVAVLVTAVLSAVYMLHNKKAPPDALITVFTSTLTALVGLFVKSPTQ